MVNAALLDGKSSWVRETRIGTWFLGTWMWRGHVLPGTMSRYFANRTRFAAENHPVLLPVTARPEEPPPTADKDAARDAADRAIDAALAEMAECDIVIVDTPGSATPLSRMGHERADVLLTPVNDSLVDLDVLAELDPVNRRR